MADLVETRGYIPGRLPEARPQKDMQAFVEDRFKTSQEYAESLKNTAWQLINEMREYDVMPGFDFKDRAFEFDLDYPEVSGLTVPDPPSVEYPDVDLPSDFPRLDDVTPPSPRSINVDTSIPSELQERIKQEIMDGLKAPEGYSPEVERGIYDRARSRRRADLDEKKQRAADSFARRGFLAPPGALLDLYKSYDVEDHREEANLNRDIVNQQADILRQKYELLLQSGLNLEGYIIERARVKASNAMEAARLEMQFIIDTFTQELRKAETQSTLLQNEIQLYAEQTRVESLKLDMYRSRIQGVQSQAELERIKAQILGEKRQAMSDQFRFQLEQDNQNLTLAQNRAQHRRAIAEHVSQVVSQLAASAMTVVSTSAQVSGQASDQASYSYQMALSRYDGIRYNYSGSTSEI
ncbi:MAG: hypothetical protein V5B78_12945 [Desulfohalobiaceae bacterium]